LSTHGANSSVAKTIPPRGPRNRLVRGGGDDVSVRDRVEVARKNLARDETGEVRHVHHEDRADLVGDRAHLLEIDPARVGAVARQQDQRADLVRRLADLVEVQQFRLPVHGVGVDIEELAGDVVAVAVRQVPAGVVVEREDTLIVVRLAHGGPLLARRLGGVFQAHLAQGRCLHPRGEDRAECDEVGIRPGVRLEVGVLRAEQFARQVRARRLDRVHVVAPGVEAVMQIPLGVLVAEEIAHR
jgi:hypothetical protein